MYPSGPLRRMAALAATTTISALLLGIAAGTASAHVTISPSSVPKGGFSIFSFSVPNERDAASTTSLQVQFPSNQVIPSVSVQPVPGWTTTVAKRPLATPVKTDDGTVTQVVDTITWTGGQIKPGEFQLFTVSAGPLPTKVQQLTFKAIQTYSNGEVVRWIEVPAKGAPEPEHPAPTLTLTAKKK
jgi:uncharacterized protein YcnI